MKYLLCFLFTTGSVFFLYPQGIDNLWLMGYNGGGGGINIEFSSGTASISLVQREMNFSSNSVSMCDSSGNLLFCSNGVYIANSMGDTMLNGSGLSPSYYTDVTGWNGLFITQAALIIPNPGSPGNYYLFHGTVDDSVRYAYYLYYSEIDMSLDSGRGAVVTKNNILIQDTLIFGRITGVKHANGRDWWVLAHEAKTDRYYIGLVDPSGIHFYDQHIGSNVDCFHGQICFSPDGSKLAYYDGTTDLEILDFDRCSGAFTDYYHIAINDSADASGVAFSASSRFLYVTSTSYAYQFDLQATNVEASKTTIAVWDSFFSPNPPLATTFNLAQLAPDGKIYVSCGNGTLDMHVINYPDSLGIACDFCQHCIHFLAYNAFTVPNFPNYFLGAVGGTICDSLPTNISQLPREPDGYELFPNPTRDLLYITLTAEKHFQSLEIFNSVGQLQSITYSNLKKEAYLAVNVSSLASGIYFLKLNTAREKIVRRFIKE